MRNKTKEVGRRYFLRECYIPGLYPLRIKSSLSERAFQDDQICIFLKCKKTRFPEWLFVWITFT